MLTFDQASVHADMWLDEPPSDIYWPSVIPYQVIAMKNLMLSLFVEMTK